jgi:prolyl-tRNA editing enzyme YbaK/EbsC (Cys-tRNA(Pro) deacylase)
MHPTAEAFEDAARADHGIDVEVHEFDEGTKTAAEAAEAIGCDTAQIASSLAFDVGGDLVVVVASGANRVSERKLGALRDVPPDEVSMADAGRIKATLGWSIGGVPPFCHETDVPTYLDETLTEFDTVWAAAGTPDAVFPIAPERIREIAGATVVDIRVE